MSPTKEIFVSYVLGTNVNTSGDNVSQIAAHHTQTIKQKEQNETKRKKYGF